MIRARGSWPTSCDRRRRLIDIDRQSIARSTVLENTRGVRSGIEKRAEYPGVPDHLFGSVKAYVLDGQPMGQFLTAVASNNLHMSIERGDAEAIAALRPLILLFYNECPHMCWGSRKAVDEWIRGLDLDEV